MINYTLICHDCDSSYDSWFRSSEDYESQKQDGLIECPMCGSQNVDKGLMAPAVKKPISADNDYRTILRKTRQYIEQNFENVGDQFADEAIAINRGEKDERNIYGKVDEEAEERLQDEGIDYVKIPWVPKEDA